MKKFVSLLLAVVLLAAMLTVFAVPAFADAAAAISGYVSPELVEEGVRITSLDMVDGKVSIRVEVETETAGRVVGMKTEPAGSAWVNGGKQFTVWAQILWKPSIADTVWTNLGDPFLIDVGTGEAVELDISDQIPEGNSGYFSVKLYKNNGTGSTLSEGSLTIIVGIAAAVVFGLGGFFIGKAVGKKKKPALASGTDNTDEE